MTILDSPSKTPRLETLQRATVRRGQRLIRRVRSLYGDFEAARFGYQQFEVIRSGLVNEGLSRGVVNENTDRLVRIFKWAASRNLIPPTVPQSLGMIERLTPDARHRFRKALVSPKHITRPA